MHGVATIKGIKISIYIYKDLLKKIHHCIFKMNFSRGGRGQKLRKPGREPNHKFVCY